MHLFTKFLVPLTISVALEATCHPLVDNSTSKVSNSLTCSQNSFSVVTNDNGIWPYRKYKTSEATPPQFLVSRGSKVSELSDGLVFLTLANTGILGNPGVKQQGALVMSLEGDLIWEGPIGNTSNLRTQVLNNEPVLTYWTGIGSSASSGGAAHGYGSVEILNNKYETIYSVCPKLDITLPPNTDSPCVADVHESYITPDNTMLVTVYNITQADLTGVGGPKDGWVYDPLAVEVDLETNEPIFIWDPLKHVPIESSHSSLMGSGQNMSNPYDWFHMNSIQSHHGNFLINSRQTWASYYVNRKGHILWQIDGKHGGDFGRLPPNGHYVIVATSRPTSRFWRHGQMILTYFADNNGDPITTHKPSVALGLVLDVPPNKNKPPRVYNHLVDPHESLVAFAQGSYTTLDNGNYFVGYGTKPIFKEFGASTKNGADVLLSVQFAHANLNSTASTYRAYKQKWNATPSKSLSLVVDKADSNNRLKHCAAGSQMRGYVSWNGATGVKKYAIYVGQNERDMQKAGEVLRAGFETEFVVPKKAKYVQVSAVGDDGEVGKSTIASI